MDILGELGVLMKSGKDPLITFMTVIILFRCEPLLSETEESARQQSLSLPVSRDQACERSASSRVM